MHASFITAILACAAAVVALPTENTGAPQPLCPPGLYSNPECCATDVLGIADLDCAPPPVVPWDIVQFDQICASEGQRARCCAIPVAGQAVLCEAPL